VHDPVKFNDLLEQFVDGLKTPGRHEKKRALIEADDTVWEEIYHFLVVEPDATDLAA
jgi:hypothetical protein